MFTTPCFIRKNTPELRNKLEELGYRICICTKFNGATWLDTSTDGSVHGVGHFGEDEPCETHEESLAMFLYEHKAIDCDTNEDLLLALAALRDDSDYMQWFCDNRSDNWVMCKDKNNPKNLPRGGRGWWTDHGILHKASVEEILEHFKE